MHKQKDAPAQTARAVRMKTSRRKSVVDRVSRTGARAPWTTRRLRISGGGWRRPAAIADGEESALGDRVESRGRSRVAKHGRPGRRRRFRARPDRARRAGGAVLGSFEMADEVVVLERRGRHEQRVK